MTYFYKCYQIGCPLKRTLCTSGFFFWYSAFPEKQQAAVDDEEQRPMLQDILEAAVDDRRQLTSKNSGHSCKTSSKQPSMGIMSRENSRGDFPLPSSRFLLSSVLLDSSIIDTSMQGSCQRQPCCHRAAMVVQERCCVFEL